MTGLASLPKTIKQLTSKNYQKLMHRLTARERQVLHELCQGHSQKIVADKLKIKPETVKFHVSNILAKLDASNIAQAAFVAGKGKI